MGPIRNPKRSTSGMRVTLSYLMFIVTYKCTCTYKGINTGIKLRFVELAKKINE